MSLPKVFVVGGTGAQGIPVIRGLVEDNKYAVRALTRDTTSARAQELLAFPNVELISGTFASETDLRAGYNHCDFAFINIDGFNAGEKTETYWAIRSYELALESGIKFFVYGNLDYGYKLSGYNPKFRTGHYDGKGRIGDWILDQNKENHTRMGAALFTTGPYMEMAIAKNTPMQPIIINDVVTWRVPLSNGAIPHVSLDDCSHYVRWLFDSRATESNGLNLRVAIAHITYTDLSKAFTEVTGLPSRYEPITLSEYWNSTTNPSPFSQISQAPAGYNADTTDPASMTIEQNFTGFWNLFAHSADNETSILKRDYELLDRIHPNRIRSAREWFEREDRKLKESGVKGGLRERVLDLRSVLKIHEDGGRGRL